MGKKTLFHMIKSAVKLGLIIRTKGQDVRMAKSFTNEDDCSL